MKTLDMLSPGESATIVAIVGDDSVSQRLAEMGMIAGAICEVVRFAPLGDPMEIILEGYHLSLRKSEARTVRIEVTTPKEVSS